MCNMHNREWNTPARSRGAFPVSEPEAELSGLLALRAVFEFCIKKSEGAR